MVHMQLIPFRNDAFQLQLLLRQEYQACSLSEIVTDEHKYSQTSNFETLPLKSAFLVAGTAVAFIILLM
jgi:hypothetical protein